MLFARVAVDVNRGQMKVWVPFLGCGCTIRPWSGVPGRPGAVRFPWAWFWHSPTHA